MKPYVLFLTVLFACSSTVSLAQQESRPELRQVYINENFGFNVEGYKYEQSELPCEIDRVLVEKIIQRAPSSGLDVEAVHTADKIHNGEVPVLAIDIEALVLGSEEYTYGTHHTSNLPSVRVTAALFDKALPNGFSNAKHSCAIATLNELTSSSNILDMGTGHTVCSATRRCLTDLSNDIIDWVAPQLH